MHKHIERYRLIITFALTTLIIIAALLLAYIVRFDLTIPPVFRGRIVELLLAVIVIKLTIFWFFWAFRGWWRYVSMPDLVQIVKANLLGSLIFVSYAVLVYRLDLIPRSVLVLDAIFCFLLVGGICFATRAIREAYLPWRQPRGGKEFKRVIVVGAGDAGQMIAREIRQNAELNIDLAGFVS